MSFELPKTEKIAEMVNAHGMRQTAGMLGISAASVCRILKRNGYRIQRVYILPAEAEAVIKQHKGVA